MRILVTGGAGFIGSHLVRALLRQGDEVVVFDRVPVPHLLQDIMDSITYVQGDSSSDLDLYRAVATNGIEGIFHLGALMAGVCEQNPPLAFQVNFRSTQVLLDAAVACGVKRFFFMSSISLYSPTSVEPVPRIPPPSMGRPSWPGSICCAGMPTTTASTAGASVPHGSGGPTVPTA
jgi:UDP-glucose 4-epimerase